MAWVRDLLDLCFWASNEVEHLRYKVRIEESYSSHDNQEAKKKK